MRWGFNQPGFPSFVVLIRVSSSVPNSSVDPTGEVVTTAENGNVCPSQESGHWLILTFLLKYTVIITLLAGAKSNRVLAFLSSAQAMILFWDQVLILLDSDLNGQKVTDRVTISILSKECGISLWNHVMLLQDEDLLGCDLPASQPPSLKPVPFDWLQPKY